MLRDIIGPLFLYWMIAFACGTVLLSVSIFAGLVAVARAIRELADELAVDDEDEEEDFTPGT